MKKKKPTYKNQFGEEIKFELVTPHIAEMTGFHELGLRYGWNDDGAINMVEPNGGPYLIEGMDVGKEFGLNTKKKAHCFIIEKNKITIHLR
jgi:hypothetical protein